MKGGWDKECFGASEATFEFRSSAVRQANNFRYKGGGGDVIVGLP